MATALRLILKSAIMERYYNGLFSCFILLASCFFASCQEGREAGDLFGEWRLSESKYISFSGSITLFRCVENNKMTGEVFGNFQHVGDSLFIQCYSKNQDEEPDNIDMIENHYGFKPFNNIRVKIDAIDSDRLILSKDGKIWSLKKW